MYICISKNKVYHGRVDLSLSFRSTLLIQKGHNQNRSTLQVDNEYVSNIKTDNFFVFSYHVTTTRVVSREQCVNLVHLCLGSLSSIRIS